jgi:hypothetical protein
MSLRDILVDRVKDKLYHDLVHRSLKDRLLHETPSDSTMGLLRKWDADSVTDIVDNIINAKVNEDIIDQSLDKIKKLDQLNDQKIKEIADKLKSSDLDIKPVELQYSSGIDSNSSNITEFPFNTRSLLQMCWGLTLNLSHETPQTTIGATFKEQINQTLGKISALSINLNDSTGIFIMNLQMALSSTIRNLGFIRATHTEYLNYNGDRLSSRRENLEQIADFASFKEAGLFTKIGAFIGFGSLADLITAVNTAQISFVWVPVFIVGGIAGAFAVTVVTRFYVMRTDDTWDWKLRQDQNRYWKEHYKRDVTNELYNLYISIIGLIEKYYTKEQKEKIMAKDELLRLSDKPKEVKEIISKFLAPDNLEWFPMFLTTQQTK